jgi:hypothetical protein
MIYMWFTGINYYKLAVEKDRDSTFTTITTIWKPGFRKLWIEIERYNYIYIAEKLVSY